MDLTRTGKVAAPGTGANARSQASPCSPAGGATRLRLPPSRRGTSPRAVPGTRSRSGSAWLGPPDERRLRAAARAAAAIRGRPGWLWAAPRLEAEPGGDPANPPAAPRAGAAASDITPPVGTPMSAYTARSCCFPPGRGDAPDHLGPDENLHAKTFAPSNGIHTRVKARAIVIEQDGEKSRWCRPIWAAAVRPADPGGATAHRRDRDQARAPAPERDPHPLLDRSHLARRQPGLRPARRDTFDPRISALTAEGIAEAVRTANSRLRQTPASAWGPPICVTPRATQHRAVHAEPGVPDDETAARPDSIDPQVTVLRVDALDGPRSGFGRTPPSHPTSSGREPASLRRQPGRRGARLRVGDHQGGHATWQRPARRRAGRERLDERQRRRHLGAERPDRARQLRPPSTRPRRPPERTTPAAGWARASSAPGRTQAAR